MLRWKFDTPKLDLTEKPDGLLSANTNIKQTHNRTLREDVTQEGGKGKPTTDLTKPFQNFNNWMNAARFQQLVLVLNVQM